MSIDQRFEGAWVRVALAGRELGSGPHVAGERIALGVADWLKERNVPALNADCIALGVAVGLVMAEDKAALDTLHDIYQEWLQQR